MTNLALADLQLPLPAPLQPHLQSLSVGECEARPSRDLSKSEAARNVVYSIREPIDQRELAAEVEAYMARYSGPQRDSGEHPPLRRGFR